MSFQTPTCDKQSKITRDAVSTSASAKPLKIVLVGFADLTIPSLSLSDAVPFEDDDKEQVTQALIRVLGRLGKRTVSDAEIFSCVDAFI
ncbi:hypothetical protein BGX26_002946, partial [Mortierella sp. AD094]